MPLARDCSFGQKPFFKPQVGGEKFNIRLSSKGGALFFKTFSQGGVLVLVSI